LYIFSLVQIPSPQTESKVQLPARVRSYSHREQQGYSHFPGKADPLKLPNFVQATLVVGTIALYMVYLTI